MVGYVAYVACLRGTDHWNVNSTRSRAKDTRRFIGRLFDPADPAHGWHIALAAGWRVRRATLTLAEVSR